MKRNKKTTKFSLRARISVCVSIMGSDTVILFHHDELLRLLA